MSPDVDLSIRQFAAAWRLMCSRCPGYAATNADGIELIFSGLPIAFFNVALLTGTSDSPDELRSSAVEACAWAGGRGVPWLLVVTHENLADTVDATAVLDSCGLAPMMPLTGMRAEWVSPVAAVPEGLELTMPEHDGACAALLDVNGAAYGMDLEAAKTSIGRRAFWEGQFPVVGLRGTTPVSCAVVMMVDGVRYVAMVATNPGEQRRGYGDAAMRHALDLSARTHGERPTVLHATEAGRPVYERMGYTTLASHTVFIEKRFLAAP